MKEQLIYEVSKDTLKVECFKVKEDFESDAYKVVATNTDTDESDFVTTDLPQAAIALADYMINN